jgi:hypothetical protein
VSSTTIRYSGVPENSHSRRFDSGDNPAESTSDLTRRWRSRLREESAAAATGSIRFTPGKAGPLNSDPRHNRAYPHPQNPGLHEQPDGFYDWADRRLYLSDGSPDPMTPGAYRYQTRPDVCDLDAPDSDPSSPRYEPDHLRHKPGDTWIIDRSRPYDVHDPGPFGSPGWFPDHRTGRHRRDELPDPIPWWESEEEATDESANRERRRGPGGPEDPPGPPGGSGTTSPGHPDEPGARHDRNRIDRSRKWTGLGRAESAASPRGGPGGVESSGPERHSPGDLDAPHQFGKLREDAWDRFIEKSEPLAAAHHQPVQVRCERTPPGHHLRHPWMLWLNLIRGLIGVVAKSRPARPVPAPVPVQRQRPVVASDRRTHLASRTARFAGAVRGAQRARAETAPATGPVRPPMPHVQQHWQTRPRQQRPSPGPTEAFMAGWERQFDQTPGGAAWA